MRSLKKQGILSLRDLNHRDHCIYTNSLKVELQNLRTIHTNVKV